VAPARKPVRTHEVRVDDGTIYVIESDAEPNLPPTGRR
jgi:3-phenylpropionate/trans-cinnamate dioxygenase ferredoxin subunit